MPSKQIASPLAAVLACALIGACGGGSSTSTSQGTAASRSAPTPGGSGPAALSAESQSAATGDIPDNQVFLTFRNQPAGYTISYPEGWAQRGSGGDVTFQAKNNVIHVVASSGPAPDAAAVSAQLAKARQRQPTLSFGSASTVSIQGSPVLKISYSTLSAANPVTGKRVQLLVDRYVYAKGGKLVTVDLGTPKGVDNIDAYRKISRSLRWL